MIQQSTALQRTNNETCQPAKREKIADSSYDASCPHCGHVQTIKLKGLFGTPEKGKKGIICKGEDCDMPFTVAWKKGEGVEVRRER